MIEKTTAIPLALYPYSTSSHIVHWITLHHGRIATLLRGAMRPKSPFLGEYALFCTSELLFFTKRTQTLYTAKECAMLTSRPTFRQDWRAMQTASYLTALVAQTTPDEIHHPELFTFYETLLDECVIYGRDPAFLIWAELHFLSFTGHAPFLDHCVMCRNKNELAFSAINGGTVCTECIKKEELTTVPLSPETHQILHHLQHLEEPQQLAELNVAASRAQINQIMYSFMTQNIGITPNIRNGLIA